MIETQNKKAIRKLSGRSFRVNRFRNIVAIAAIALTAVLFTTVATIGISFADTMLTQSSRMSGGRSDVNIKELTQEEAKRVSEHPLVREYGFSEVLGFGADKAYSSRKLEVRAANELFAERFFCLPETGSMPKGINEIAMDTLTLDALGIPHETGREITFSINLSMQPDKPVIIQDSFILSGFWKGDSVMPSGEVWVSQEYIEKVMAENSINSYEETREEEEMKTIAGMYHVSFMVNNKLAAEKQAKQIMADCEIPEGIRASVNTIFSQLAMVSGQGIALGCLGIGAIMFIGYLLIFNVFQISIVRDIRFYGLLKTVGTTGSQIKKIIMNQTFILAGIGIPAGLILGYVIGVVMLPIMSGSLNGEYKAVFNPLIFLLSAVFALMTILISVRKPVKMAAKVSPVEAVRFAEYEKKKKTDKKPGTRSGGIWKMALRNLGRNKKKTVLVMTSLCLSLSIFNYMYLDTKSFNLEKFIERLAVSDFLVGDAAYMEAFGVYNPSSTAADERLIDFMNGQPGIEGSGRVFANVVKVKGIAEENTAPMAEFLKDIQKMDMYKDDPTIPPTLEGVEAGWGYMDILGYDPYIFTKIDLYKGEIDMEKLLSGNYVIMKATHNDDGSWEVFYNPGDEIVIEGKTYEVMAIGEMDRKLSDFNSKIEGKNKNDQMETLTSIYMPISEFSAIFPDVNPLFAVADVQEEHRDNMKEALNAYQEDNEAELVIESRDTYLAEYQSAKRTNEVVGYSLSIVLALIGILNFFNTMITSIFSRKKEFAMMQSVGMTGSQLKKMLLIEGLYYVMFSVAFMAIAGNIFTYVSIAGELGGYKVYSFSPLPLITSILLMGSIAVIVPLSGYYILNKASIVERLREAE